MVPSTHNLTAFAAVVAAAVLMGVFSLPAHAQTNGGLSTLIGGTLIPVLQEAKPTASGVNGPARRSLHVIEGRAVTVAGKIDRALSPSRTRIRLQIRLSKRWKTVKSGRVSKKGGRYRLRAKIEAAARYRYRVLLGNSSGGAAHTSSRTSILTGYLTVYKQVVATWFGPGFYGNGMACGPKLTKSIIAVAHPSLPCGSTVRLFANGRVLKTKVLDKCRCTIDLTAGAAKALGINSTRSIGVLTSAK